MQPTTRRCGARDLSAMKVSGRVLADSDPWQFATGIGLTNRSASPCTLGGWVTFTMVGISVICIPATPDCPDDPTAARPDQSVTRVERRAPQTYLVKPGEHVALSVFWDSIVGRRCEKFWYDPSHVEIRVPGDTAPIVLKPPQIQPCRGAVGITAIGEAA
ncbi:hypothetical protein [Micromonospora sp. NPDC093277]|uniref:hypothetical protein n=1 Tax=Micromonospora sp. NPDC093277 TaxID=3364291 RepID=UPI0038278FF1